MVISLTSTMWSSVEAMRSSRDTAARTGTGVARPGPDRVSDLWPLPWIRVDRETGHLQVIPYVYD